MLFCMIQSVSIGQIQKQDWKGINQNLEKRQSSEKSKELKQDGFSLKIEEKESSYFQPIGNHVNENLKALSKGENEVEIIFEEERQNVMLSLLKFSWMISKSSSMNKSPTISIVGFSSSNQQIDPIIISDKKERVSIEGRKVTFDKALSSELNIAFPQAIVKIKINTQIDNKATSVMEWSPVFWSKDPIVPNPPVKISNCEDININVILDHSASMTNEEKEDLRIGLLDFMEEEIIGESLKANIAFIEFGKSSEIATSYISITKENISPNGGAIYDYLYNAYGKADYSKQNWTNWEGAFQVAAKMNKSNPANILIFATDGLPNGTVREKMIAPKSIEKTIQYSNQIKKAGTHIFAIGNKEFKEEVAAFWFGLLTNGQNTKTNNAEDLNNINTDFFVVNSFREISTNLKSALSECEPTYVLDLEASLLPNQFSELTWTTQIGLRSDDYSIYRSSNKKDWIKLSGAIQATETHHTFVDNKPSNGRNYYQVKTTNNNTPISSPVRLVKVNVEELIKIYPNPSRGNIDVTLSGNLLADRSIYSLEVQDVLGKIINVEMEETETGFHLKTQELQGGTYFLNLRNNGDMIHSDRFVIIN